MDSIVYFVEHMLPDLTINGWVIRERENVPAALGAERGRMYQLQSVFVYFLEAENVPASQDFAKRGRIYHCTWAERGRPYSCNRTSNNTHNLVEEGEYTTAIDVRRGEQTSESDKTPQQQDSAQRASVIKAHNLQ
jgi:hypothetical protein